MIFKFYQIYRSLKEVVGEQKAEEVFPEYTTLSDKMSAEKQVELAKILMDRIENTFDKDTIISIRTKHPCNIPKEDKNTMLKIKEKFSKVDERLKGYSQYLNGSYVKISNNEYIFTWGNTSCVCSMFRKLKSYDPISPIWCQCCNANNKKQFEYLLDTDVNSELVQGICCGGQNCSFKIKL